MWPGCVDSRRPFDLRPNFPMALDLINTCVLLLALSLLQGFIARVFRNDAALQQLVSGLLFTGACLFAMTIQIHLVNGSTIDARALILSLGGLFGGPIVAVISASLVTAYLVGMSAVSYTDIAILLASTLLGLTFRQAVSRDWIKPGFFQLMALGFVVHACAGLLLNLVAVDPRPGQWAYLSLPMVFIFSLATAMLGLLLVDIEKRAKSESALIESQALMSHHLENTPLAAITWDKDFRCTQWNKAAEKIFGYSAAEALGRHGADLLIPQHLKQDILNQYQELINNRTGSQKVNENMTRDGKIIVCEWYNTPVFDEHGETIGSPRWARISPRKRKPRSLSGSRPTTTALPVSPIANCCRTGSNRRSEKRNARVRASHCYTWISISSRISTIHWDIRSATACCGKPRTG